MIFLAAFVISAAFASDLESKRVLNCESKDIELATPASTIPDRYKMTIELSKLHAAQPPFLSLSKNGTNISMSRPKNTQIENIGESDTCHIKISHQFGPPNTRVELVLMRANDKPIRNKFTPMLLETTEGEVTQKTQVQMFCELHHSLIDKFCGKKLPPKKTNEPKTKS